MGPGVRMWLAWEQMQIKKADIPPRRDWQTNTAAFLWGAPHVEVKGRAKPSHPMALERYWQLLEDKTHTHTLANTCSACGCDCGCTVALVASCSVRHICRRPVHRHKPKQSPSRRRFTASHTPRAPTHTAARPRGRNTRKTAQSKGHCLSKHRIAIHKSLNFHSRFSIRSPHKQRWSCFT